MGIKIAFTGSHSTGKTSLLRKIEESNRDDIFFIKEIARSIIMQGFPFGKDANIYSYIAYVNEQLKAEMHYNENLHQWLISDRTIIDTACYALINKELPRPFIPDYLIEMLERIWFHEKKFYDYYVYFPIEFAMTQDGIRPLGEEYRKKISDQILFTLQKYNVNYITVTGTIDERYCQVMQLMRKLSSTI